MKWKFLAISVLEDHQDTLGQFKTNRERVSYTAWKGYGHFDIADTKEGGAIL